MRIAVPSTHSAQSGLRLPNNQARHALEVPIGVELTAERMPLPAVEDCHRDLREPTTLTGVSGATLWFDWTNNRDSTRFVGRILAHDGSSGYQPRDHESLASVFCTECVLLGQLDFIFGLVFDLRHLGDLVELSIAPGRQPAQAHVSRIIRMHISVRACIPS